MIFFFPPEKWRQFIFPPGVQEVSRFPTTLMVFDIILVEYFLLICKGINKHLSKYSAAFIF